MGLFLFTGGEWGKQINAPGVFYPDSQSRSVVANQLCTGDYYLRFSCFNEVCYFKRLLLQNVRN